MDYELLNKLPEDKKENIIRISMEEFSQNGYASTSTNVITSRSGISKGLLFHYFGSKKKLFLYLAYMVFDDFIEQLKIEEKNITGYSLSENVKKLFLCKAGFFVKKELEFAFLTKALQDNHPEVAEEVKKLSMKMYSSLLNQRQELVRRSIDKSMLRDDIPFDTAMECIMMSLDAITTKCLSLYKNKKADLIEHPEPILKITDAYLDILCNGIYKSLAPSS
jgi:AcrR family transcriptional regulator